MVCTEQKTRASFWFKRPNFGADASSASLVLPPQLRRTSVGLYFGFTAPTLARVRLEFDIGFTASTLAHLHRALQRRMRHHLNPCPNVAASEKTEGIPAGDVDRENGTKVLLHELPSTPHFLGKSHAAYRQHHTFSEKAVG